MRYSDRDCYAALIRLAAKLPEDIGVELPHRPKWVKKLEELAARLNVPVRVWGTPSMDEGPRLILDHAPSCYGGGVRPGLCKAGSTAQWTPTWWVPSAGLGPGAVPRQEFCNILSAAERVLPEPPCKTSS